MVSAASKNKGWSRQTSSYESAIIQILKESRKPLTMRETVSRMIDKELVIVRGDTPEKSLYSIIYKKESLREFRGESKMFNKTKDDGIVRYNLNK